MFIASVIAFIAGIYIEAVHPFRFAHILIPLVSAIVILPFVLKNKNGIRLSGPLFFLAFFLAGMLRIAVALMYQPALPVTGEATLYRGVVIESSKTVKVVRIEDPRHVSGIRAIIRADQPLGIGDSITVFGPLRELALTFKNPYSISWKWMKRLEGTFCEIRGEILSVSAGKRPVDTWRRYLADKIDASGTARSGIIKALTIGDTTGLDDQIKTLFLETGTSHILSISGSHLGVLTAFFFFVARFLFRRSSRMRSSGDDRRYAALLTIPFTVGFMLTAGSSLPTIRATIMITVYMLALFFERSRHIGNTLFLSALIILVIYPHSLFSPAFQLTFVSVLFIILFTGVVQPAIGRLHLLVRWPLSLMIVTLAAMLGTLPVVLYHFHGINPLAALHNLIAVPLMCLIATPLALLGLFTPFGEYLLRLAGDIIGLAVNILRSINWGYLYPAIRPSLPEAVLYVATLLSLLFIKKRLVRFALFAVVVPVALVTVSVACQKRFFNNDLCVNYIDVGLGDAMLVEAPGGMRFLIDGGGFYMSDFDTGKSVIAPILLSKKIRTLDQVINTHPHEDHLGGLIHILRHFRVNGFASGGPIEERPQYRRLAEILKERGIPAACLARGDSLTLDGGLALSVLHPQQGIFIDDLNDSSLVLKMTFAEKSFLFTGDIGEDTERSLVLSGAPLRSSVLKVPHHGSRHSSNIHFIRAVQPQVAVLSVGPGIKGIPSDEAIERYRALSVPLYRTDRDGFIRICTDGKELKVER